jgi:transposase-like protein/IS1 family transposase
MRCPHCQGETRRFGRNRNGSRRFRCDACRKTFTDESTRPVDRRRLSQEKAILALRMLLEGNSIRSVERLTQVHRDTIIATMVEAGEACKKFLETVVRKVAVLDVEGDEIWGFVGCKRRTAELRGYGPEVGDAYCFTAIERHTKLILTWHLGKRCPEDTLRFSEKLRDATNGRFQLTTDGYRPYLTAVPAVFGNRIDFATLVKVYGNPDPEDARRYSPPRIIDIVATAQIGNPDEAAICTSFVERSNLTIRMMVRRLTRLTNAHSKKWANHEAALGLFFAYYNFCRVHSTIRQTPAMKSGLADRPWNLQELLAATRLV